MEILQDAGERAAIVFPGSKPPRLVLRMFKIGGGSKIEKTSLRAKTTSQESATIPMGQGIAKVSALSRIRAATTN